MSDYAGMFSSEHPLSYFLIDNEGLCDVLIDKDTITYVSNHFTFWLRKSCEFNEIDINNYVGSFYDSCNVFKNKEFSGNYSIYIATKGNELKQKDELSITYLINFLLKKTRGDFAFYLAVGTDILIRTNDKIYLNANYSPYDLLQFNEIENIDYYVKNKM